MLKTNRFKHTLLELQKFKDIITFEKLRKTLNYLIPAMAVFCLTFIFATHTNTFALKVKFNGTLIGIVADEEVFFEGHKQARARTDISQTADISESTPQFEATPIREGAQTLSADDICNTLVRATQTAKEATGLYINDVLTIVCENGDFLKYELTQMLSEHDETAEFYDKIELRDGAYPEDTVLSVSDTKDFLISDKNSKQAEDSAIKIRTVKTETEEVKIEYPTTEIADKNHNYGWKKTLVAGKNGIAEQTVERTYINGVLTDEKVLSSKTIQAPTTEQVLVGTYVSRNLHISTGTGELDGDFIWPVKNGGYITCGILGYHGHTGIDIGGAAYSAPILAAADGVVVKSHKGWYGYGHYIVIDHGNGVRTLYAHNSKLYVKVGDRVKQGDTIAALGATGNADGKHLHFEIITNGKIQDPADYIGTYFGEIVTNKLN